MGIQRLPVNQSRLNLKIGLCLLLGLGGLYAISLAIARHMSAQTITLDEFNRLKAGMTVQEAKDVVGMAAKEVSTLSLDDMNKLAAVPIPLRVGKDSPSMERSGIDNQLNPF